ncbi:chaperone protein dnaJ 49-like isoform X2 [Bidens hawaiensis]|uniref:chaperone protein dnaJ 49-like isoform X2 n=1 Tax=Bidens hawaiensis TaxID=980011 RepID=UPI00404A1E0D
MDGNKDEAMKCIGIAKEAIASGNKERALKFIGIAQRLNHNLSVDDLLAACKNLDSANSTPSNGKNHATSNSVNSESVEGVNKEPSYTEEHVQVVRNIKRNTDYYEILGVSKTCSVEEVKKAYRKLSLKVHPDKNKAPGSEEAFKKVSKAFKCLSDDNSRRHYDQTGYVEGDEYNQQYNVRRRRTGHNMYHDEFDADEIFRSFFAQSDMFRTAQMYRTRRAGAAGGQPTGGGGGGGTSPNLMLLLQLLPFLLIILLACLPFSEPEYSLQRNYTYQFSKMTKEYGVEFYVKSSDFDQKYPLGTPARSNIENGVIKEYKNMLWRYCNVEMQRRSWSRNLPTPHCDKLESFGVA